LVAVLAVDRYHTVGHGNERLTTWFVKVCARDMQFAIAARLNSLKGVEGQVSASNSIGYF